MELDIESTEDQEQIWELGNEARQLYAAAMKKRWNKVEALCSSNKNLIAEPITGGKDTILHIAVRNKRTLQKLLGWFEERNLDQNQKENVLKNAFGITPLHEAVTLKRDTDNLKAVKLLVKNFPWLVNVKNNDAETATFRAARYGNTDVIEYLIFDAKVRDDPRTLEAHCFREKDDDKSSILHAAIGAERLDTALYILHKIAPIVDPLVGPDYHLTECRDKNKRTCLQLLANMPHLFESGYSMGLVERLLYKCICVYVDDMEDASHKHHTRYFPCYYGTLCMYSTFWRYLLQAFPGMGHLPQKKQLHKTAEMLARLLAEKSNFQLSLPPLPDTEVKAEGDEKPMSDDRNTEKETPKKEISVTPLAKKSLPALLLAASNGIIEIVKIMLEQYPEQVERLTPDRRNILYVVIQFRQWDVYDYLMKEVKLPMGRMVLIKDLDGNTILHQVAVTDYFRQEAMSNPAIALQNELSWFQRVKEIVPTHYQLVENKKNKTAKECFDEAHDEQLGGNVSKWCKDTSQSCSTVAALIATIVYAAAYQLPGGTDKGVPIYLHSTLFKIFTVTDVIALATSLTSLVLFLSVLSTPKRYDKFLISIPLKLHCGFFFLFISVATTMVAFTVTIMLTVKMKRDWTKAPLYFIGFLPVCIFVLLNLPLVTGAEVTAYEIYHKLFRTSSCRRIIRKIIKIGMDRE